VSGSVKPSQKAQKDIKNLMEARISAPSIFERARQAIRPDQSVSGRIWSHISSSIDPLSSTSLWDRIRQILEPGSLAQMSIKGQMMRRLQPQPAYAFAGYIRSIKWVTAAFLFVFAVRLTPLLFLAPHSKAESPVLVIPTQGEISVLIGGLWQPLNQELILKQSALLQTGEGEATIVYGDKAIFRLAPETTVALHTLSEISEEEADPKTLTLHRGTMWAQSLIPDAMQGITIALDNDRVLLNEGSASLTADGIPEVSVWDRRATVIRGDVRLALVSGEKALLHPNVSLLARQVDASRVDEDWVADNQKKDATRRTELAQLLLERRAAAAGILPSNPLYSVKRVAEEVDVLFTFSEQGKIQKRIEQANTRLNEAAAFLKEGNPQAAESLQEYRDTVLSVAAVANGSGGNTIALVQQQVAETVANVTAALPDDKLYPVKEAVILTNAALSEATAPDLKGTIFTDRVAALRLTIEAQDDLTVAKEEFQKLKADFEINAAALSEDVRKEAIASLNALAFTLGEEEATDPTEVTVIESGSGQRVIVELPVRLLTPAERQAKVDRMWGRIEEFDMSVSRRNQLRLELKAMEDDPNRGPILRRMAQFLEVADPGLVDIVLEEMKEARQD
jgi:hypothetical protein